MIALVSSTIFPPSTPGHGGARTWLSGDERLEQTRRTVQALQDLGAHEIIIADNSADEWRSGAEADLLPARVLLLGTPQFRNKGIGELHLLRAALPFLREGEPIMKVSGRYLVTQNVTNALGEDDVAGRVYQHGRRWLLSTRCYAVRNREMYGRLLDDAFRELYAQAARILGPRSLLRILRSSLRPHRDEYPYDDPPVSLEAAFGEVLRTRPYRVRKLDALGVEGFIGGFRGAYLSE